MKKILIVLGMMTCLAGMTACSSAQAGQADSPIIDEATAASLGEMVVGTITQIVADGTQDQYAGNEVITSAVTGWESALPEIGTYLGITDYEVSARGNETAIDVTVDGSDHDAIVSILVDSEGYVTSVTTSVIKGFGELMKNAALNTLLGMGTVFIVLILIAWIISLFKYIPALSEKLSGKKKQDAAPAPVSAPAPAAVPAVQEEETDDGELVAVIAAAIAAYESENGSQAAPGDFVVRSIRRRGGRWQRA